MKIKPLEVPETLGGFVIDVVKRHRMVVLVRKRLPELKEFRNWEVMVVRVGPVHPKAEKDIAQGYTHAERLPASESWGTYGWTYIDEQRALERFAEACADYNAHVAVHGEVEMAEPGDEMPEPGMEPEMPEPEMPEP